MNEKLIAAIGFVVGAAIGSVTTGVVLKKRYEQIANEEIESVKEAFRNRKIDFKDEKNLNEAKEEYYPEVEEAEEPVIFDVEKNDPDQPYVIAPEEYGEFPEYTEIELTFYSDHIVADDQNYILEDVDRVIGFDSLNHFGEYEDDTVYVRNDRMRCDYAIILDQRRYEESLGGSKENA